MTLPNSEAGLGEPILQREARKALSGRVPMLLSVVLALLVGMLAGYGVRAFSVETTAGEGARELRCPRYSWPAAPITPSPGAGHASLHYLHDGEPAQEPPPGEVQGHVQGGDAVRLDDTESVAATDAPAAPRATPASPLAAY
ncbi:MAG TPA: hypothetical protein VKB80_08335 [Kofleriaceae bacterium]|nr:hypothetical protein [Kofleriaceae bacterium]